MKAKSERKWFWRIVDLINPLRDPSLTVAAVLTFIEEAGQHDIWYVVIIIGLLNWIAVRGVVWLIVNFAFASTFIARRVWWAIRHPRLAWRILDAVGHEEIVIGNVSGLSESVMLSDGSTIMMNPLLGASGIQIVGELPAGTEIPMLNMPNGQSAPDFSSFGASGIFPNGNGMFGGTGQTGMAFPTMGNAFGGQQTTEGFPQAFPQRPSEEEDRLRQQVLAISRLLDDWIQYTEEKWRTVSDSQLGWKPLRGRWSGWDDIFQDAYGARTADPLAQAAQTAGEANSRRYEFSKEKGSAASAVACFLRDMMTLRQGMDIINPEKASASEPPSYQSAAQQPTMQFGATTGPLGGRGNNSQRGNSLIRRPGPIFVDADAQH
ncbi:MAG TPA: nucleoporin [Ktedonobacteraceae bacterium]|nr:nucleoporin [Ktedonobacteraceae bacterium]